MIPVFDPVELRLGAAGRAKGQEQQPYPKRTE
jgi:hypothetical protein